MSEENEFDNEEEVLNPEGSYYWERQNEGTEMPEKVWHWTHWLGSKTLEGMEFSGEIIANFLGLTRSKYQWILDAKEREEAEKALQELEHRQRKQLQLEKLLEEEKEKLQQLERGSGETLSEGYEFI